MFDSCQLLLKWGKQLRNVHLSIEFISEESYVLRSENLNNVQCTCKGMFWKTFLKSLINAIKRTPLRALQTNQAD